ncbi:hypothetical protein JZU68_06920 [bacterium]|nr:hypothetical protein [bacterium]
MKNHFLFFFLFFAFLIANAQESTSKITLKSGAVFVGEVILKNDELIMLKGARFQFALPEIEKIEKGTTEPINTTEQATIETSRNENFCGHFEISFGNASARKAFGSASASQVGLTFGNRKSFGKDLYIGIGAGHFRIADANLGLIPATLKIQTYTTKNRTSPFVGFESGYAFSATKNFDGGPFAKISLGINHRLNYKSSIYAGISAAVYSISGQLSESTQNGIFTFDGTTIINALGLKVGFQF